MPDDIIREARELCERATPGPWYWDVIDAHKCICLKSASWKVMDFARYGMNSAAPRFLVDGIMERADTLLKSIPGKEHHRGFDNYIDHPDAAFIARSRALMPALLDLLAAKDAEIARLTKALHKADIDCDHCKHSGADCEDADYNCDTCESDCVCKSCRDNSCCELRG